MSKIDDEKLEFYYIEILSGNMTLSYAAAQEGIDKDDLRKLITKHIGDDKTKGFKERLRYNKANNTVKEIDNVTMLNIRLYLLGKRKIQDASKECGMEEETFRYKVFKKLSESSALLELYLRNGENKRDYSQVNTRLIIINMLRNDMSQTEIARQLEIPVRTISGWVNKLPEEDELRKMAKDAANRALHSIRLTSIQLEELNKKLDKYVQENDIVQQPIDTRSFEERELEKVEEFLSKVYELEAELDDNGKKKYTRKDIMRKLGVGFSAIRRAERKRDNLQVIIHGRAKQKEKGE